MPGGSGSTVRKPDLLFRCIEPDLPIRQRVDGEVGVRIVPVEVDGDVVGDDLDKLAFELLRRLVLGRDAAVGRVQNFAQVAFPFAPL